MSELTAADVLARVLAWADRRCPCGPPDYGYDEPAVCPLCGARVDGTGPDGVCKAAEYTIPRGILDDARIALRA